jgi:hypothetical protein
MDRTLKSCKFGITSYFKKGPVGIIKSRFGSSSSSSIINNYYYITSDDNYNDLQYELVEFVIIIMTILSIALGFIAVDKLCNGDSPRSKNTRLGMYAMLILSGGLVGWAYILMWVLGITVC